MRCCLPLHESQLAPSQLAGARMHRFLISTRAQVPSSVYVVLSTSLASALHVFMCSTEISLRDSILDLTDDTAR